MNKQLIIIAIITLSVMQKAYSADCNITLKAKTDKTKSAKIASVSFSSKQLEALRSVCNVKIETMNRAELIADYEAALDKKLAKQAAEAATTK